MSNAGLISYEYITAQPQLDRAVAGIRRAQAIALDFECDNNLHRYGTRLCLIQLSTPERNYIIDAQAGLGLSLLREILEDSGIVKVMHDTDFDLRCIDCHFGWRPKNLFDTQIAARLCGHKDIGLAALIERYFGIRLRKSFQRADWTIRPISPAMLDYAAKDSHFLLELRDKLLTKLKAAGRLEWAQEEFLLCEQIRFVPDERPLFARVKGFGKLRGRQLAILAALAEVREEIAQGLDLPVYKVIANDVLIRLALNTPRSGQELMRVKGLHPYCRHEGARRILEAIQLGMKAEPPKWPLKRPVRKRHESLELLEALKSWRAGIAAEQGIDADLIFPLQAMKRLAAGESLETVLLREPVRAWQRERFGSAMAGVIKDFKPPSGCSR